jgi:hypothetical protein
MAEKSVDDVWAEMVAGDRALKLGGSLSISSILNKMSNKKAGGRNAKKEYLLPTRRFSIPGVGAGHLIERRVDAEAASQVQVPVFSSVVVDTDQQLKGDELARKDGSYPVLPVSSLPHNESPSSEMSLPSPIPFDAYADIGLTFEEVDRAIQRDVVLLSAPQPLVRRGALERLVRLFKRNTAPLPDESVEVGLHPRLFLVAKY